MSAKHCLLLCIGLTTGLFSDCLVAQTTVLDENFKNNTKGWYISDNEAGSAAIKNEAYYLECKPDDRSYLVSLPKISYTANSDFSVSFTVKWIKGIDNNGYGIFWGSNKNKKYSGFFITANGNYHVIQKGIEPESVKPWTKSGAINKNGENRIRVECKNKNYDFYINDKLVFNTTLTLPEGGDFYFKVNDPQQVVFDDVHLEQTVTANTPAINSVQSTPSSVSPVAGLTDTLTRNGVTFSVNPAWKTDPDFLKMGMLKTIWKYNSTFPDNAKPFKSLGFSVTNKAGSVEDQLAEKGQTLNFVIPNYFDRLPATGKNLVKPADKKFAAENYQKKFLIRESFKTVDGNTGELMIYQYKEIVDPYIIVTFRAIYCIGNQANNQVATLSFTFEASSYLVDHDFANEGAFSSDEKQKEWIDFVKAIAKTIKVKFNNQQPALDIGSFVRQCTDTLSFQNVSVNVNPEWKKLTGYTYPGSRSLYLESAWKAAATLPISTRLEKFNVVLKKSQGTVQSKISSIQSTQRFEIKDFYTKLNSEGLSNLSAEEILKTTEQEFSTSLSVEDVTTLQEKKVKLTAKETRSIRSPMVYYSFEVTALLESTITNEYIICSIIFHNNKMLDQFTAKKQSMFATADEKKQCLEFCRELLKTIKVR